MIEIDRKKYYVYLHRNVSDNKIFYVGKGRDNRAYNKYGRSDEWLDYTKNNDYYVEILKDKLLESEAFKLEYNTIVELGIDNLLNKSKGFENYKDKSKSIFDLLVLNEYKANEEDSLDYKLRRFISNHPELRQENESLYDFLRRKYKS